jgi:hypothetical protein
MKTESRTAVTFVTSMQNPTSRMAKGKKGTNKLEEKKPKDKEEKDLSHITCFVCGEQGHYATKCPKKGKPAKNDDEAEVGVNATWEVEQEANMFVTLEEHVVNRAGTQNQINHTEVLLDNQADISILHPSLLSDVRDAETKIRVKGIGGFQMVVKDKGMLKDFFEVYASEDTKANVLSFAEVEDVYPISYIPQIGFIVHLSDRDLHFKRRGKLYVADWSDCKVLNTVTENERCYTKAEVKRAMEAYAFMKNSGYPSMSEAGHLIMDGNINNTPNLARADFERSVQIYGLYPEYVKGKLTRKVIPRARVDTMLRSHDKQQLMYTDVMHLDGKRFLITVTEPLNLTLQSPLDNESRTSLGLALQGQIGLLRSRGFIPVTVYTDPHSSFKSMTQEFAGVEIDVGGAGDYVSKVDAKIRRIKETYRCVKNGLPWKLPPSKVKDLIGYSVSRLNIRRTSSLSENICPRVLFTGIKVDFKKELNLSFGDYVEAYESTDNTSAARSAACIALYPISNAAGSWILWKLETNCNVQRTRFVKLVTTEAVINKVNRIAEEEVKSCDTLLKPVEVEEVEEVEDTNPVGETLPAEIQGPSNSVSPGGVEDPNIIGNEPESQATVKTNSGRIINKPSRFLGVTKVPNLDLKAVETRKAISAELKQLFEDLQALCPVLKESIPSNERVLKSHMFVVEKYLANGKFEKMKARLVADGRDQDPDMFPNKSSPTVSTQSVLAVLGVIIACSWRTIVKIDIKGAFVQTPMTGDPVYMRINPKITKQITELFPKHSKFVDKGGFMYTVMRKAMYGCIQASSMWFNLLTQVLREFGYEHCPTDKCVMRKVKGDRILLLLIYVDDILAIIDDREKVDLKELLVGMFGTVQYEVNNELSYLGMQVKVEEDSATIDMSSYVRNLVRDVATKVELSPGTRVSFKVDESSPKLEEKERKWFHSLTAKLLYLAKRARPDILTMVCFLCTRVQEATVEDKRKLHRVLGYLKGTVGTYLKLKPKGPLQVEAYIDASFASHPDSKSHTGVVILVAGSLVYVSSKKQKCVTKSPTEAELVGLTDNIGLVELVHEFLEFVTMKSIPKPIIYQDSTSVISLITKGGGITRTKHLRARMHLGKEAYDNKCIQVNIKAPRKWKQMA